MVRLSITDFRCYRFQRLETDERPVVITGPNGAGKTNLLEAVSFLVPGRGLRGASLASVARRAPDDADTAPERSWAVAGVLKTGDGIVEIGTGRDSTAGGRERRLVQIDGRRVRSQTALASVVSAVWLTPQMDRLFLEGAAARRRFLDRLVFGFDPEHAGRVAAYDHALRERARLLRDSTAGRTADSAWLSALEETMAAKGVAVAAARRDLAMRLAEFCGEIKAPFPAAEVRANGAVETWLDDGPALAAEDKLRAALAASRREDAERGGAAVGPHRGDLTVRNMASGLPAADCSTGEQKALLISILLANARLQAAERRATPLLLFDEVAAHLDAARRAALFAEIRTLGAQAWLTGTDRAVFETLRDHAQFVDVERGVATLIA